MADIRQAGSLYYQRLARLPVKSVVGGENFSGQVMIVKEVSGQVSIKEVLSIKDVLSNKYNEDFVSEKFGKNISNFRKPRL